MAHNISINVTKVETPLGVRRRRHLRSLSDLTPAAEQALLVYGTERRRARSHPERPRAVCSARCSPVASRLRLESPPPPRHRLLPAPHADPWRKMSDTDLPTGRANDPWVKNSSDPSAAPTGGEGVGKRESTVRRGKLERAVAVSGEAGCGCRLSPRPSPRLAPRRPERALSAEDARSRPRLLYKSSSQRTLGPATGTASHSGSARRLADPLLETTC